MGALSVRAAASRCHSPSGCMQWDSKYKTYTHTVRPQAVTRRVMPDDAPWAESSAEEED